MVNDDSTCFQPAERQNFHMVFNAVGKDVTIILEEIRIRCARYCEGVNGLVFISDRLPELDSFAWCNNFTEQNYQQFLEHKKSQRQVYRPHDPIAFFTTTSNFARVKLTTPKAGRYVTIKLSSNNRATLYIEHIGFACVSGSHPLASLIGSPQLEVKAKEMREELVKAALSAQFEKNWNREMDEALVSMIQQICTKLGANVNSLDAILLNPTPEDLIRFKALEKVPLNVIRARFSLIKYLNRLVTPLLEYVDIRMYVQRDTDTKDQNKDEWDDDQFDSKSLSYYCHNLKGLYWMSTKQSLLAALLNAGSTTTESDRVGRTVTINRIKALRAKENPGKDPNGLKSVFGQVFTALRNVRPEQLRGRKYQQLFSVTFLGEGSIDVGGPYRECFSNMSADLMSHATPLFVECPNQKNNVGLNREKWVINPSANSSIHLAMYEFLGMLMGVSIRTSETLNIELPSLVWKQLLYQKVNLQDLEGIDKLCIQALTNVKESTKDQFESLSIEKFTTLLSNGKEVEVKPGGKSIPVTHSVREEFVDLSISTRLHEADQQIASIRKGLNKVVSANLLSLFSWYDLEILTCGTPDVNLDTLRKHTIYRGISAHSPLIKNFWRCLESFNNTERQLFLRFTWGRSRLPLNESDWTQQFTIRPLKTNDDSHLPISHTCFFSLDLPTYSTYKILRKKILFAIFNCQAIDIDFNPNNSSLSAWVED